MVASLWDVRDDAAQALMGRFYANLWERHLGKLEALREAQLWMHREWRPNEVRHEVGSLEEVPLPGQPMRRWTSPVGCGCITGPTFGRLATGCDRMSS